MNPIKARIMRPPKPPTTPPTTAPTGKGRECEMLGLPLFVIDDDVEVVAADVEVDVGTVNPGLGLGVSPKNLQQ